MFYTKQERPQLIRITHARTYGIKFAIGQDSHLAAVFQIAWCGCDVHSGTLFLAAQGETR